jgi:6-phospho-3-hexuloisomerase
MPQIQLQRLETFSDCFKKESKVSTPASNFTQAIALILQENVALLEQLQADVWAGFIEDLTEAPRVFVVGEGRSGLLAKAFAMRLMHLQKTVFVVGETTTPAISQNDLIIAYSGSGETTGTFLLAEQAVALGAKLIAITAHPDSRLGRKASRVLKIAAPSKGELQQTDSMQYSGSLFEQGAFLATEAIVFSIMTRWGKTPKQLWEKHANLE